MNSNNNCVYFYKFVPKYEFQNALNGDYFYFEKEKKFVHSCKDLETALKVMQVKNVQFPVVMLRIDSSKIDPAVVKFQKPENKKNNWMDETEFVHIYSTLIPQNAVTVKIFNSGSDHFDA